MTIIITLDGEPPIASDWHDFVSANDFEAAEAAEILTALEHDGCYVGGGGAAPFFTLHKE